MPGYTSDLYNYIVGIDPTFKNDVSFDKFKAKMSDVGYSKNMYDWIGQNDNTFQSDVSFDAFREKLGYKKKEPTVLPSVQKPKPISSDTQPKATQKPSGTSVSKNKIEVFTNFPGKEDNEYRIVNNNWQRKEPNKDWTTVRDSNAIIGLNKQYKKNIVPTEGFEGISGKLIDNEEETVIPYLQKNYGRLGFNFEQTGGGDRVRVVTQDGKNSEVFMLDNWTDEGDSSEAIRLKAWLKENMNTIDRERYNKVDEEISAIKNIKPKERESLKSDAFSNMSAEIPAELALDIKQQLKLKEKEKEAMQYNKSRMDALMTDINKAKQTKGKEDDAEVRARVAAVYGNKDEIAKQNRYISNSLNDIARVSTNLNRKAKEYDAEVTRWQADLAKNNGIETPELAERKLALQGRAEMLNSEATALDDNLKLSKSYQSKLDDIAGEYMLFKESKGSTGGAMINNFLKGATNIWRFAGLEKSSQEELIKLIGSDYTTEEFATSKERSDIEKVLFSLSNSIGAAVGGGGVATLPSFYAQTYYDVKDEMDENPDFNGVPELEKTLLASTIGLTVGWLEKFGLDRIMSKNPLSKSIVNRILLKTVGDLPKNATTEMLEQAVNSNVKTLLAKGAINIAGGALVEGSTEFAQEFAEGSIKELYNKIKGKEMFQSPESLLAQSFEAAYLGAMGGAIMQSPVQAAQAISTGLSNKNNLAIEILEKSVTDSELRSMMTSSIKAKIVNGELTKEEGEKQLEAVNEAATTFERLPDNIQGDNRKKSFDLLVEKSKIEKEIAGKDENLVAVQKARIAEINNELKTISENAVKESTKPVEEGPAEGGGIQYQGTQEGQPEVREGERPVGQAAQPEADLGDRAVEGRGVKEEGLITNLDEKINRYETEQAAEGIGTEETVTTDEGKEIKRTKFRAPKNANTKAALAIETGTNPRAAVLKYFISGGKINSTAIQKLFGDKQGRSIKGEVQNRLSFIDNKVGKTPEQIAEYLWMEYGDQFGMTDVDFIPFVEEVISEFKGTTGMVDELLSYENKTQEDYYKQKYGDNFEGYDVSELEDAESVLDYMTDEEIIQMSNEIEAAEAEFAQAPEIVVPEETLEDLKTLDVTDKTNLQKVQSFLDKLDKDIDKFGKETLGVNLPIAVAKAVIKTLKTLVDAGVSLEQALKQAAEIHNVSEVDIVDSFEKIRQKETEASKAAKKISRPTQKKVVVNEATALRDQLRLEARAARESAMDLKRKQRALVAVVNGMKRSGSINTTQATALAKRIVNTNIDNPVMVKRMLDYAGRLFQDAEYKNKLSNARSINKKIKSAIKSKDLQASVVAVAKDFSKIDPRLLEDIDRYIENATKVLDAVKRTRLPEMREAMNFDDINAYTEEANAEMEEYRKEEVKELNDQLLESIDTEGMTATELMDLIRSLSDVDAALPSEKKRAIILDYINKVKDAYTPIVESIVKGTDPFTGDSIDTSKKAKELIGKLIDIDINKLDVREAVKVIDAINNFITNGITDNVESIVRTYEGQVNAQEIADSNMPIREAKLGGIARLWSEQMMNLPVLADWIFKSPKRAIQILNKMGFTDFQNGVAKAVKNWTNYVDSYHNTFKKKKANGKNFMDAENIYERGVYAFLKRTVTGDEIAQQKEFERKVGLISKSIDVLKKQGSQKDLKVAEMYEQLMDKFELNKDGVTISDVESKVDPINKDAVNWWINTWAENYGDLADVSQNVYNTVLGKDINYTPDKFSSLDVANSKQIEEMIDSMGGGGFAGSLNYEYDKKTGVLMPSSKPVSMETGRYVNLNFDMNNSRALKAALVDINTAGATKQIKGFLKSDSWNNIIKNKEDRDLFRSRVDSYILASRNKRTATDEQALAAFERTMRAWASIGATRALGGIFQPVKQVVPVMVNTAINVGRNFSLAVTRDQYSWIDKIGMPISNRGIESMAAFEDADKEFENNVAIGAYTKAMSGIEALNKKWLKLVLSNPDVFAARSSFIAYYKQALRAKGMSANIDFTKPEDADQEALSYAQHMVDRQQNVSDAALMGDLFTSNQPLKKIIKNTLFPFMSFVINQKSRMVTDLATFSSKDVSIQEKINAFKSLSALTSEMAVFHTISFAIKYYIVNAIVGSISGEEEDEEEVEKAMKRQFGYTVGTVAKDILSPVPIATDKAVESGVDYLLDIIGKSALEDEAKLALKNENIMLEDEGEDPITGEDAKKWIEKYVEDNRVKVQSYEAQGPGGVYRIAFDKFSEIYDTYKLASEGSYESEGFAGKPITKYIDEQGREDIKEILPYYAAWSALGIPAEFGTIFRKYESKIKRDNGLTEKQKESEKEVLKESNKEKLNDLEFALVKKLRGTTTQSGAERVIEELNWIKENGGVKGDKQIKKYIEILEANGEVMYDDLKKIQSIK